MLTYTLNYLGICFVIKLIRFSSYLSPDLVAAATATMAAVAVSPLHYSHQ